MHDQNPNLLPENALLHELEAWSQLESRIQREILHPVHLKAQVTPLNSRSAIGDISYSKSSPLSIGSSFREVTEFSSTSPLSTSPNSQFLGISHINSSHNFGSPNSPHEIDSSPEYNRALSTTPTSPLPSIRVNPSIPVYLQYSKHVVNGLIQSIIRSEDAEVITINTISQDRRTELLRHSVDPSTPSQSEISMIPYLDNHHVDKDEAHRYRLQMLGSHRTKITKFDDLQGKKISRFSCPPVYTFRNKKDFQHDILGKEIKYYPDIQWVKSTKDKQCPCRLKGGAFPQSESFVMPLATFAKFSVFANPLTVNLVLRNGLYRYSKNQKNPKTKVITLESLDGRPLHLARKQNSRLQRNNTQCSITTVGFQESTNDAYERIQNRSVRISVKSMKGLIVGFYDVNG